MSTISWKTHIICKSKSTLEYEVILSQKFGLKKIKVFARRSGYTHSGATTEAERLNG